MPLFRRYNGMFSMHSPRERWAADTVDSTQQLVSAQQRSLQGQPTNSATENRHVSRESAGDVVSSPCSGVCVLSKNSEMCNGCFRTKAEISNWTRVSNTERGLIVNRAAQRKLADSNADTVVCNADADLQLDSEVAQDRNLSG